MVYDASQGLQNQKPMNPGKGKVKNQPTKIAKTTAKGATKGSGKGKSK